MNSKLFQNNDNIDNAYFYCHYGVKLAIPVFHLIKQLDLLLGI